MNDNLIESIKYFVFFILIAALAFGGFHVLRSTLKTQYPVMVVVSESMIPALGVGDFIVVSNIDDYDKLMAAPNPDGDVIVFERASSIEEYIVHRAIEKESRNDVWWFTTKGDNNMMQDPRPVPEDKVVGKVVGRIPILGYFPLFIKSPRGFLLVAGLMAVVFFADYIIPDKREKKFDSRFPWWASIPYMVAPFLMGAFWFIPNFHFRFEILALLAWYVGCLISPLAFEDDDMSLMVWLYHFVLVMIPMACDMVWWTAGITPSDWWTGQGSTVPIKLLLQKETVAFIRAFNRLALYLFPGCAVFLLLTAAKRRGAKVIEKLSLSIRETKSS